VKLGLCYRYVRLGLLAALTGCSNASRYPPDLKYPLRKDLLVLEQPKTDQRQLPPPGHLDESIAKGKDDKDAKMLDPGKLTAQQRGELRDALRGIFGTPAEPKVALISDDSGDGVAPETAAAANRRKYTNESGKQLAVGVAEIDDLELDEESLRRGSGLYRRHCLHCHGVPGDGRGPTGPWVNPHPRDYRAGKFKFISTNFAIANRKPRRADLLRTLSHGIDGTSMPSFGVLPERHLAQLASYVTHLSIRGEVEFDTMTAILKDELQGTTIEAYVLRRAAEVLVLWANSNATGPSKPPPYPEQYLVATAPDAATKKQREGELHKSISKGYKLFLGRAGCAACHTDFGRQAPYKFDEWGTLVRPRNLTEGQYRGGRRPIDLYWRMAGGIPPSGMSALEDKFNDKGEIWDLINFVQALPYPAMLPADVREKIYGTDKKPPAVARAAHP
jgi:mono/diheme cytochrome c family protein